LATASIAGLAALRPRVLAPGHGRPVFTGTGAAAPRRPGGRGRQRAGSGLLRPVDYSARVGYRRLPPLYRRLQPLGVQITALGLSPRYVVVRSANVATRQRRARSC
jgi:hypothetical protein